MLTFLNSVILGALAAVAIPLLIHLFNKQRKKKIVFSSLRFLKLLEKQRLKRLKLYQYLLILIRSLLVLFLVLAFARPTLTGESELAGGAARTTAIIFVDDAVSMRRYDTRGSRFDRARQKVKEILEQFSGEDRVFLLRSADPRQVVEDLDNLQCSYTLANWPGAFTRARQLLAENPNFNREIYIVSDFQFDAEKWTNASAGLQDARCYLFRIADGEINNSSIDTLKIISRLFEINRAVKLEASLRNHNSEKVAETEMHLFVNGERIAFRQVSLKSGERKTITLSFQPRKYGNFSVYLELSDDDLLADNRYYLSLDVPHQINVLYVDDTPAPFLKAAWQAVQANSNIRITTESYSSWGRQAFNQYQVLFLGNVPSLAPAFTSRLRTYLSSGGAVIFMPGLQSTPAALNRLAAQLRFNIKFQNLIKTASEDEFFSIRAPSLNHPVFEGLFRQENPDIQPPSFAQFFKLIPGPKTDVILRFNTGDPFLLQNGTMFIIASYLDVSWTDLPYRGLFIPLLVRLFHLGAASASQIHPAVSTSKETSIAVTKSYVQGNFFIQNPAGRKERIVPAALEPGIIFNLRQLPVPGIYRLYNDESFLSAVSANIPASGIVADKIESAPQGVESVWFDEDENFRERLLQARVGQELWWFFLFLALLMIAAEIILIKKTEGRN